MKKSVIALMLVCALGGGGFANTVSAQSQSAKQKAEERSKAEAQAWNELYPEIEKAIQAPTFRDKDYPIFKFGKKSNTEGYLYTELINSVATPEETSAM